MTPEQIAARKAVNARYRASPAGKAATKAAKARYKQSAAGKAAKARERVKWKQSPAGAASTARTKKTARVKVAEIKAAIRDRARFVGCDGEGIGRGTDHRYTLFRMGDRELYRDGARLTTPELLTFILDHPSQTDILIGFAFEYDVTSILADAPPAKRAHMIATFQQKHEPENKRKKGGNRWTWLTFKGFGTFGVNWLARNHFKVCRPHPTKPRSSDRRSTRVIFDTWGFFATSFLKAIKAWEVGREHWATIEANKDQRSTFETITPEIRAYNGYECDLLADMMGRFREACFAADIKPRTWNGAGKIAAFLHRQNGTLRRKELAGLVSLGLLDMAHAAYYGGRFEITRAGLVAGPIHEHDVNSAYPDAMRSLPCLIHGKWKKVAGPQLADAPIDATFVCPVRFSHPPETFLCGLPFRARKDGRLSWPQRGNGVYWSHEIKSAERLGAKIEYRAGYLYERRCECKPFEWIETRYRQRKALGQKGEPIKRGINSLYGKLAQRIGEPPFANPIWAGLITAHLRSRLNDAIASAEPESVIMLATDALYTTGRPLTVEKGDGLGQWSVKPYPSLFVVQPGLYWPPKTADGWSVKSRGISPQTIAKFAPLFEDVWRAYSTDPEFDRAYDFLTAEIAGADDPDAAALRAARAWAAPLYPFVKVVFPAFIGLRLAAHWGKPELAGKWLELDRKISFDWSGKRASTPRWSADHKSVILDPKRGDPYAFSAHYTADGTLESAENWEAERMLFEAMPDAAALIDMFSDDA